MTYFLFAGDLIVMAFMFGLVIWVFVRSSKSDLDQAANIPLEDERHDG
jgi:cbb3-type cytochrome oxidase subunit 3